MATIPESGNEKTIQAIISIAVIALAVWYFFGGGVEREASKEMTAITQQTAHDSVQQYAIAKRAGNKDDMCAQSQLAAAVFLQAKDEANYKKWSAISSADCAMQ